MLHVNFCNFIGDTKALLDIADQMSFFFHSHSRHAVTNGFELLMHTILYHAPGRNAKFTPIYLKEHFETTDTNLKVNNDTRAQGSRSIEPICQSCPADDVFEQ